MSSIRLLRTFLAVASEGSFAAASARVALTQAAVGQQMRALEAELRRPLFERQGKSVTLSESGRAVLPQVHALVTAWDQLASTPAAHPMAGTVHLGAIVSALRPLTESTLALKARHAGLALHVTAAKSADLLARVEAGELDGAVVVREGTAATPGLAWTALYEEPMVLLAPGTLPASTPRVLLQRQAFIRFDRGEHTGRLVERTLHKLRVKPAAFLELNTLEGIVDLVRSGLGVAIVPLLHEARWQADARLRVLPIEQAPARRVAMVQRRGAGNADAIAAVVREIKARLAA